MGYEGRSGTYIKASVQETKVLKLAAGICWNVLGSFWNLVNMVSNMKTSCLNMMHTTDTNLFNEILKSLQQCVGFNKVLSQESERERLLMPGSRKSKRQMPRTVHDCIGAQEVD